MKKLLDLFKKVYAKTVKNKHFIALNILLNRNYRLKTIF
jgi:hypothetical protein